MKTTSLHIAFAALLSLLLLASCSRNDEVAVAEGEEGKVQVTFTLKLDNESSASRAMSRAEDNTWGDEYNYDLGNDYDNRINDLQVVIYEGNTFKCKVTNLSFYKNEEKNDKDRFLCPTDQLTPCPIMSSGIEALRKCSSMELISSMSRSES